MFEYTIMSASTLANEKDLNKFGNDMWELVTIIQEKGMFYYYFKRTKLN